MSLENTIERFCSQNVEHRERDENAVAFASAECSHCSRCSQVNSEKNAELKELIRQVNKSYKGGDPKFLEEYINDVICEWHHDLDKAIACFQDFAKEELPVNNRK
jgi:hypothetical protein